MSGRLRQVLLYFIRVLKKNVTYLGSDKTYFEGKRVNIFLPVRFVMDAALRLSFS